MKLYQGIAHGVYNKKFSSFALFEGNPIEGFHNYQKSVNYQATEHDDDLLSKISTWLLHNAPEAGICLTVFSLFFGILYDSVYGVLKIISDSWFVHYSFSLTLLYGLILPCFFNFLALISQVFVN